MNTSNVKRRNSRWDEAPILDRAGRPRIATLTERDIEGIFRPLLRYRFLPADYLHAFAGGSLDYLVDRLALLSRRPNLYLRRPHRQRANAGANHRRLIYELADRGIRLMQERGAAIARMRPAASFAHELMVSVVMASFELGAREAGARLIGWGDILASRSLPDATRHLPKPYSIPVSVMVNEQRLDANVVADGYPFGVERATNDGRAYFFCPGVEADCGTEPIQVSDFARSSITRKLALYLAIDAQRINRTHFGFPNLYAPFITTNETRLASMMGVLHRLTNGAGSRFILFKTFPSFTSFEQPPAPSGHMLTEPWKRVGYPPFNFLTS